MHNAPLVNGLLPVHSRGGTVVLTESYDAEEILKAVAENRVTALLTVPAIMHRLLDLPSDVRAKHDLASLKDVYWGGNPLEREIQLRFRETFSAIRTRPTGWQKASYAGRGRVTRWRPSLEHRAARSPRRTRSEWLT
jgi:acyl-coenzyme A synthetase/AMP-(fatty) acid ligase